MAFFSKSPIFSQLRSHRPLSSKKVSEDSLVAPRRGFHTELGAREKALLAEDPALKHYKSHKKGVRLVKRIGDVLTIVVVASCCYEIYVRAVIREEARRGSESS